MQFISFTATTIILLIQSPLSSGFTYPINSSIMAKSSSTPAAAKKAATKKTTAKKLHAPTKKATSKKSTSALLSSSPSEAGGGRVESGKIVTIEACKQWSVFKTRASKIVSYLTTHGYADTIVQINKDKPTKGNFIVRVEGKDEPILELVGMTRPFKALKDLGDMEEIGKLVIAALDETE